VTRLARVKCRAKTYEWYQLGRSHIDIHCRRLFIILLISPEFIPPSTNIMSKVWFATPLKQLFHIFEMFWCLSLDCLFSFFYQQWQLCALLWSCLTKEVILFIDVYQKIQFVDIKQYCNRDLIQCKCSWKDKQSLQQAELYSVMS